MNILVTGGASGLGAAIVNVLAKDSGNTVYFTYARSATSAKEIEGAFPNTRAISCDFTNSSSVDSLIGDLQGFDIDVLVNNAFGNIHKEHFYKTNPDVFLKSFEQNITPTLRITQEAIKIFRKKKFGKIINIISAAVINKPPIGWSEYAANKSYLLAMSKAWATECIKFNITSNCISPAFMLTNLTGDTDERIIEQMTADHPLKRLLTTDEAADAVLFFTKCSQHINGVNLVINAGAEID
jgi:3-oxoacyl-[acyl-carrier protein] reductase